jgi:NADH-quinone oxidoreductase subunit H
MFFFIKFFFIIILYNFFNIEFLKSLPIIIPILLAVAFFTVFERKILAGMQRRRGPNVVGIYGLLQAIADALKLLAKETIIPGASNIYIFIFSPIYIFLISMLCWSLIPFDFNIVISDLNFGLLFLFAFSSLGVYGIIMSGWSSNSKYSFPGALRSSAQFISYEISMGLLLIPIIFISESFNLTQIVLCQSEIFYFLPFFPFFLLFLITVLAETNRVPFDLPEAESELVSGYNVEYSSIGFTFFFLSEYSNIILMSSVIVILYLGGWLFPIALFSGALCFSIKLLFIMFFFVWIRATLPRYRYDQLMNIGWKIILPLSLGFTLLSIFLIILFI